MFRSLRIAALGMAGQQLNVDVISNNLANVNTTGYKKSNIEFQDLLYNTIQTGSADGGIGHEKPSALEIGSGNRPVSTFRSFTQGDVSETGNSLDVAINGRGFFQIMNSDGTISYSRDGTFRVNSQGNVVTITGLSVYPELSIPQDTTSINIKQDGTVSILTDGQIDPEEIGQIELASFMNPAGLKAIGGNLYSETESSGQASYGMPGDDGFGSTLQGYLEKSNVDVVQEMISLIVSQRAYEINSKAVKTADELLAITNNIKR